MSKDTARHAGSRRAEQPRSQAWLRPALLALAVIALVVAWGFLVKAAIDFGASARGGEGQAWAFLAIATLGAVACLFVGLILGARLLRTVGLLRDPEASSGGRRAAR